jgi:uncharacterized protein (TIGR03435 family)
MRGLRAAGVALLLAGVVSAAWGQGAMAPMARDADPSFEVATIKPNNSGIPTLLGIAQKGRDFTTINSSLIDLIGFAYGVQAKQVIDAKGFAAERYDIEGVPDVAGVPSIPQQKVMVQKLLKERFKLAYHEDKKEMPAFVMTVAKDGPKLTPTTLTGLNPVNGVHASANGWVLSSHNASMAVLAGFLQLAVVDRPVVDHTGLTGRYDIDLDFTPDTSQFNGHPPPARQTESPSPNLFDALQQELGLKLTSEKALVAVVVVDHAEKPSGN